MSDDLQAAAERYRANLYDDGEMFENSAGAFLSNLRNLTYSPTKAADAAALAKAYLAARPADDSEAVTWDWIKSIAHEYVGPKHDPSAWLDSEIFQVGLDCEECRVMRTDDDDDSVLHIPIKTRHAVRNLCRVLGIEIKEQVNG